MKTLIIKSETIDLKINAKGLIIRDEYLVISDNSRNIKSKNIELKKNNKRLNIKEKYLVKSDKSYKIKIIPKKKEKLKKSNTLAVIYNNSKNLEKNKNKTSQLNKEIEKLETEYKNS